MRVALILLSYAVLLGSGGAFLLRRAVWVERAPRLGMLAWQVLTLSVLASLALAGLAVAVPIPRVTGDLAELLQACVMALSAQYTTPGGAGVGAAGAVLAFAVAGWVSYCLAATLGAAVRERRRHLDTLAVIGRKNARLDAVVLDHAQAAAYCLPGRRGRIVLTSAALQALGEEELQAVLAHERAHLRERHDLAVAAATALARAFPKVPTLSVARDEIARLAELAADDAACRVAGRLALAEALLTVAGSRVPAPALAAGGSHACRRVRRLLTPRVRLGAARAALVVALAGAAVALPLGVAAQPAIAAQHLNYCPLADTRQVQG